MASPTVTPPPRAEPASLENFGYQQELSRALSFRDLVVYGLVFMLPIAPFAIFGGVYQISGGMVALAYVIGMVAMMFGAVSYAQMSRAFPMAGSVYSYAGRGIGAPVGFLAGWAILLDYVLVPGLLYLVASFSMNAIVTAVPVWLWLIIFVGFNTVINYFGIRLTAQVNMVFLFAELAVLALVLVFFVVALAQGKGNGLSFDPFYNPDTFSFALVFGAVSLAMLSFLGFDGISMLAEENREDARQMGRAMVGALLLAGALFIAQTWLASAFVADPAALLTDGDPNGVAFNDAAAAAGGAWLGTLTAAATAIAWGFANALVAQTATSRLLFAMARDRQLPRILARGSPRHSVPTNSVLLVGLVSLALGLYMASRDDALVLMPSLVNFGALTAFIVLHASVIWYFVVRNRSRNWLVHLVVPLVGLVVLGYVVWNISKDAWTLGVIWLAVGVLVLIGLYLAGRRPALAGLASEPVTQSDAGTAQTAAVPDQREETR